MLVKRANAVDNDTTQAACFYHQCNQSTNVPDGMTGTSLSASLLQKVWPWINYAKLL